jgi:hypothetical protein
MSHPTADIAQDIRRNQQECFRSAAFWVNRPMW